jgi:hypothetical protein
MGARLPGVEGPGAEGDDREEIEVHEKARGMED